MSSQQMTGVVVLSLGLAALIASAAIAWMRSRLFRAGSREGSGFILVVGVLLVLVGLALCYFGISAIVEGGA
jgi:hypothetical protein